MKKMKKSVFLFAFASLLFMGWAQNKVTILEAWGHSPISMSPNGRYLVGGNGFKGFVYDCASGSLEFHDGLITGVSNNKSLQAEHFAGEAAYGTERVSIYDTVNKRWRKCEILPEMEGKKGYLSTSSGYGMSADGKTTTGMIYKTLDNGQNAYLGVIWEDTVLKKVLYPFFSEVDEHGGARPTGISADGKFVVGFASNPGYDQRTPHYWKEDGSPVFLGEEDAWAHGEVYSYNIAQGKFVGMLNNFATIWDTNKSRKQINPLPGWGKASFHGLSDNGVAVGFCQIKDGNPLAVTSFLWHEKMGHITLKDYCYELYDFDLGNLDLTSSGITPDGRTLFGWTIVDYNRTPFVLQLDSTPINTRPLNLMAKHQKETMYVHLNWGLPLYNGKEVLGYNIYRNNIKINTSLLTELKYTDSMAPKGNHSYAVTAVYENGESKYSKSSNVEVIEMGGCYSVKYIYSDLVLNKTHNFHWGLPTSEVPTNNYASSIEQNANNIILGEHEKSYFFASKTDKSNLSLAPLNQEIKIASAPKYTNSEFDLIDIRSTNELGVIAITKIGDFYYGGLWNGVGIRKYNSLWEMVETIIIPDLPGVIGFQQVGERLFVICENSKYIYEINLENKTIITKIEFGETLRHFCYIPELDEGKGGFEIGNYGTSSFVKMDGTPLSEGVTLESKSAMSCTYYDGKMYFLYQNGKNNSDLVEYDFNTKQPTGVRFDLGSIPEIKSFSKTNLYAGRAHLVVMEDSTIALAAVIQCDWASSLVAFLELKSMPGLKGFKVYRNGELFSGEEPIQKRNMQDVILTPGHYFYQIEAHFENGCVSAKSDTLKVTVISSEGCTGIEKLTAIETNKDVLLSYEKPDPNIYPQAKLIGVNIYRNGIQLNENLHTYLQYVDKNPGIGQYMYTVEAVYSDFCKSSDSISFDVTHQGTCEPVEYIYLKSTEKETTPPTFDVTAEWELPFMERPFELRYGDGSSAGAVGLSDGTTMAVAIGFDSSQLDMYRGHELIGMNLIIRDDATISPFVLVNEEVVYDAGSIKFTKDEYFNFMFPKPIPVGDAWEIVICYKAEYKAGASPISYDFGPAVKGYGDLFSVNMKDWYTATQALGLNANWTMAAIFAKPREVATTTAATYKNANHGINIHKGELSSPLKIKNTSVEPLYTPEVITLEGFNIYRDTTKLNTSELLKTPFYVDKDLVEGTYTYKLGAIYNTCNEVLSAGKNIRLIYSAIDVVGNKSVKIYPNPTANGMVTIEGEYVKVDVLDIFGRYVTSSKSSTELNLTHLSKGLYTLRFTHANQKISSQKLVIK